MYRGLTLKPYSTANFILETCGTEQSVLELPTSHVPINESSTAAECNLKSCIIDELIFRPCTTKDSVADRSKSQTGSADATLKLEDDDDVIFVRSAKRRKTSVQNRQEPAHMPPTSDEVKQSVTSATLANCAVPCQSPPRQSVASDNRGQSKAWRLL